MEETRYHGVKNEFDGDDYFEDLNFLDDQNEVLPLPEEPEEEPGY